MILLFKRCPCYVIVANIYIACPKYVKKSRVVFRSLNIEICQILMTWIDGNDVIIGLRTLKNNGLRTNPCDTLLDCSILFYIYC